MINRKFKPPLLASWLLKRCAKYDSDKSLNGDFDEEYFEIVQNRGEISAWCWYWFHLFRSLPFILKDSTYWSFAMFANYLKIALRNIKNHKGYSFIIISGLTVSLALGFLIIQILSVYYSYDEFHENKDRIYRVITHRTTEKGERTLASAPPPIAASISQDCPGVEKIVRIKTVFNLSVINKTQKFPIHSYIVDPDFLTIFDFELEYGDRFTALTKPYSIILELEQSQKFFGNQNPVGKILNIENYGEFTVTGVLKEYTDMFSHVNMRNLISSSTLPSLENQKIIEPCLQDWQTILYHYVYFLLKENTNLDQIESVLQQYAQTNYNDVDYSVSFRVQSLLDILPGNSLSNHLGSTAPMEPVYILVAVAIMIALAAGFNYTNLSMAKAISRAREVGIRKVVGAKRFQLFFQFTGEAIIISLISLFLAFLFYKSWLVPSFQNLNPIFAEFFTFELNLRIFIYFIGFSIFTGIAAGIVPAFYISKFKPVKILRNVSGIRLFSKITFRKVLIVFQFTLSLIFIISMIIAYQQVRYIRQLDPGFNYDNIVNVELKGTDYQIYRQEISTNSNIVNVSACDFLPGLSPGLPHWFKNENMLDSLAIWSFSVDQHYIDNLKMELVAGSLFPKTISDDHEQFIIINELAAKNIGYTFPADAISKNLIYRDGTGVEIIGVVKDFAQDDLYNELKPCFFKYIPENFRYANIRISPNSTKEIIPFLKEKWETLNSEMPFTFYFYDDLIEEELSDLEIMKALIRFISILAIFISCLGLLGIADYSAKLKIKEIGVRKVLGASVSHIVQILSKEFTVLLLTAVIIAVPLSFILNQMLLQIYERHVPLRIEFFILGSFLMLFLGLSVVLLQSVRAAQANPVDALKYE